LGSNLRAEKLWQVVIDLQEKRGYLIGHSPLLSLWVCLDHLRSR